MGSRQVASDDNIANRTELLILGRRLCTNCNGLRQLADSITCTECYGTGRHFDCKHCRDTGYEPDVCQYTPEPTPVECTACRDRADDEHRFRHGLP